MELFSTLNTAGRHYLVYIDAEFQTYRVPEINDPLEAQGYVKTPYDFGMHKGNYGNNKYHFLLNLGFIVIGPEGLTNHFAMFPSKFMSEKGFGNPQLLEPGYTTCKPYIDHKITTLRQIIGAQGTFPYYGDFSDMPEKKAAFETINAVYNSSISEIDLMTSYATLSYFLNYIAPHSMIVHKGRNDLYALSNSARLFGLTMPPLLTRDLDRITLNLPGLKKGKLNAVQQYFTDPPPLPLPLTNADPVHLRLNTIKDSLVFIRKKLLGEIREFFIAKWGSGASNVAAHNPLVDCVYTAIMDLGLGSSADGAISEFY